MRLHMMAARAGRGIASSAGRRTHVQQRRCLSIQSPLLRVSEEVQQALSERRAVVALESTIYTHGFPYPDNIALASHLESVIRTNGGVPATIGILDGVARVGLDAEEVIRLAGAAGKPDTLKVSRRDLGFALGLGSPGRRYNGGTTVAGTMLLAHLAGIDVFATGGLGGVHRGAESSMDISADLTELGRTPVAVIGSGCKSFLDIQRTLEYLETEGVPVATFADGRQGKVDFPAFWSRESGIRSPMTLSSEAEAAGVIHAQRSLGIQTGLLFANPIPTEAEIPKDDMDRVIGTALDLAHEAGAHGNANTPFVLSKIRELTESRSVTANRALVAANAKRATTVAIELMKLRGQQEMPSQGRPAEHTGPSPVVIGPGAANYTALGVSKGVGAERDVSGQTPSLKLRLDEAIEADAPQSSVFVAGSLAVDYACDFSPREAERATAPSTYTSNPARIEQSIGGVAQNVARAAGLLSDSVRLCSAIGDDLPGSVAMKALSSANIDVRGVKTRDGCRTAQYVAMNDVHKDLVIAMADMGILGSSPGNSKAVSEGGIEDVFENFWLPQLRKARPKQLVVDANWQPNMLARWFAAGKEISARVLFEPVSTAKGAGIFQLPASSQLDVWPSSSVSIMAPNTYELAALHSTARSEKLLDRDDWWKVIDSLGIPSTGARTQLALATYPELVDAGIPQQSIQLLPFVPCILTKLGPRGVLLTQLLPAGDSRLTDGAYAPYILSRCNNGTEDTLRVGGLYMRLFPAIEQVPEEQIVSVNGVGDTFLGTIVAGLDKRGSDARIEDLVDIAQQAAVLTLKSRESVSPGIASLRSLL